MWLSRILGAGLRQANELEAGRGVVGWWEGMGRRAEVLVGDVLKEGQGGASGQIDRDPGSRMA